jgi:hypothetical protein
VTTAEAAASELVGLAVPWDDVVGVLTPLPPWRGCQVKCVTFSHLYSLPKQHHKLIEGRFPLRNRLGPLFGHVL